MEIPEMVVLLRDTKASKGKQSHQWEQYAKQTLLMYFFPVLCASLQSKFSVYFLRIINYYL